MLIWWNYTVEFFDRDIEQVDVNFQPDCSFCHQSHGTWRTRNLAVPQRMATAAV